MLKIPDTSILVTTTVLNKEISRVQNKIPNTINLVTATVLSTEISEVDNIISDHSKYSKLNLVNKTGFNNKITNFNKL